MFNHSCRFVLFIRFAIAASCCYVNLTSLRAQTVGGTILGQIQDQQGTAIGKVEIAARNLETGVVRSTFADDTGEYRIPSVPAGSYEVTASVAGFKTEIRSGIVVTVGADVAVNFSMAVGAVSEKIEVTAQAPQVDVSSSTLSGLVNSTTIRELPLNGRDWLQLALLQPGVDLDSSQNQSDGARGQRGNGIFMSISGGRPTDNAFLIDGIIINDYANASPGSSLRVNLGVDAILEFSVLTNTYSAEYGRGSGGVINAITKSGTNQIHGSAFEFVRNSVFDARNFFDPHTIPPFRRDQYGGAVGGPIRKNKTFFFINYEKLGELLSASSSTGTLSMNARNGILCANAPCTETTQIAINPKVLPFLALYPIPNGPVSGNTAQFLFNPVTRGEESHVTGKFDQYFSAATTISGSYSYDNTSLLEDDNYGEKYTTLPTRNQYGVVSLQHVFSPTLLNITRVGVSRTYNANSYTGPSLSQFSDPAYGFLPGQLFGSFNVAGISAGLLPAGTTAYNEKIFGYTSLQASDDLSWTKGRHNIHAGFSFERIDYNYWSPLRPGGTWSFTSIQNFLEGIPSQFQADLPGNDDWRGERNSVIAGYIQDDFRVRSNFTLNLGVRYEMSTVVSEANNLIANLRNLTDTQPTVGAPLYKNPTLKDFAPRVGFAWDPFKDGKTAVRGGFGMFDIVPLPYLFASRISRGAPLFLQSSLSNPPPSSFPNQVLPLLTATSLVASYVQFNPKRSYMMQMNLNVQRQLTRNLALTVGYVGSAGVHLYHIEDNADMVPPSLVTFSQALDSYVFPIPAKGTLPQKINPNFGQIIYSDWSGQSNYHALQANLVQRPIKGLTYQIAYAWQKSIDNGSATFDGNGDSLNSVNTPWNFDPRINRGVSDFDVPQHFVANFQYELPVPAAVEAHAIANTLLGGWQVGGIYTVQSGLPFTLIIGSDQAFTGTSLTGLDERPQFVNAPGCNPDAVTGNINDYINFQCFAFPAKGQLGNLGRNTLHMPVFQDLDFSVFKNQRLWGEKLNLQFRAEAFNILNNVNFTAQTQTLFNGSGQLVTSVGTPSDYSPTAGTSRQIQLGVRLQF